MKSDLAYFLHYMIFGVIVGFYIEKLLIEALWKSSFVI